MKAVPVATAINGELKMTKLDKRATKRFKSRYGHSGAGSVHTREASDAEVYRHVEKAKKKNKK